MYEMFYHTALTEIDLSNFDTRNVTRFDSMFSFTPIKEINIENFDLSSAENLGDLFYKCPQLEHIYVSDDFNIPTGAITNNMFALCTSLPNFDSSKTDGSMAKLVSEGGYLEKAPKYSIQLKHNGRKAFPKVAVDGTTIVDNNGVLSATAQTPSIATTSTAGIVKPDGTSITVTSDGTISAVPTTADTVLLTQAEYDALTTKDPNTLYVIVV